MLNHAGETLLALLMILSSFLGYWLVWSEGDQVDRSEPKLTQNRSRQSKGLSTVLMDNASFCTGYVLGGASALSSN
jgi:hypothetical protein